MNKYCIVLIVLFCLPFAVSGQITDFKAHSYEDSLGKTLNYRLLKPAHYDSTQSYPLVLFLHGAGERGSDNFSQLKWGAAHFADPEMREKYPAFVLAPQVPEGEVWSSLPSAEEPSVFSAEVPEQPTRVMQLTIELLEKLSHKYNVDSPRLYVTGLSMGGFGTFDLIERYPRKFAAAVPICGGGNLSRAFLLKDQPLWVFHGAQDQAVDVQYSRAMVDAIQLAGGHPGFTEYPDAGHIGTWVKTYRNPELYKWMFSKELTEHPSRMQ